MYVRYCLTSFCLESGRHVEEFMEMPDQSNAILVVRIIVKLGSVARSLHQGVKPCVRIVLWQIGIRFCDLTMR